MRIGHWQCDALMTGEFKLDGGAMFGSVPKPLWDRINPADELNRIQLATRSLLLRRDDRVILVDLGCGTKFNAKQTGMFAIDHSRYDLERGLAEFDLTVDDVTDVIITHLHFDHAGGATYIPEGEETPRITVPNAHFHVQQANLDAALSPNMREQASYLPDTVGPVADLAIEGRLEVYDGSREIMPGLGVRVSSGHTDGMQVVEVRREDDSIGLMYGADLVPSSSHIKIPYCMGYDLDVRTLMGEKQRAFDELIEHDGILLFEHDPNLAACKLTRGKKHFEPAETYETFQEIAQPDTV